MTLEIGIGDLAENAGEAAADLGFRRGSRRSAALPTSAPGMAVIFSAPTTSAMAPPPGGDEIHGAVKPGRAGRTGVFGAHGRDMFQPRRAHGDQGAPGKSLMLEAVIVAADKDAIDIAGCDAGMLQRRGHDLGHQLFGAGRGRFAELAMRPTEIQGSAA